MAGSRTDDPLALVRALALALPGVEEGTSYGLPAWKVRGRAVAWERPLRVADRAALGDAAPDGPVLGVRVPDLEAAQELVRSEAAVFTIPHLAGYPAVLVDLEQADEALLRELLEEAWRALAPARLVREREAGSAAGP